MGALPDWLKRQGEVAAGITAITGLVAGLSVLLDGHLPPWFPASAAEKVQTQICEVNKAVNSLSLIVMMRMAQDAKATAEKNPRDASAQMQASFWDAKVKAALAQDEAQKTACANGR